MEQEDKSSLDPASVTDVETARLALRWALERIHKLQEDYTKANQSAKETAEKLRLVNDQLKQKEESLSRWQSTIKTWEAHWRDQETMEKQITERLQKELLVEGDARHQAQRLELGRQVDLLKQELIDKETQISQLQRQVLEAVREARREKDREMQEFVSAQAKSTEEFQSSLLERFKIQEQTLRLRERAVADRETKFDEALRSRQMEIEKRTQRSQEDLRRSQEAQQEKLRQKLEEQYRSKEAVLEGKVLQSKKELEELRLRAQQEQHEWLDARQNELSERRQHLEEEFDRKKKDEEHLQNQLEKLKAQYHDKEKQLLLRHEENKLKLDRLIAQNQSEALKLRQHMEKELREREEALKVSYQTLQNEWIARQELESDHKHTETLTAEAQHQAVEETLEDDDTQN